MISYGPRNSGAVVIDSVLDFNPTSNQISTENVDHLLALYQSMISPLDAPWKLVFYITATIYLRLQ